MASKHLPVREFAKALEEAGVISDLDSITRVVIDLDPRDVVKVYVQRIAGPEIKQVAGLLGEMMRDGRAAEPDVPKGVRYWTAISADLIRDDQFRGHLADSGLRIVEHGPRQPGDMRLFLIEDPAAPAELEERTVELTFAREADGPVKVIRRDVVA